MTHKRIVAALALAFALGISISFVNLNTDPSVSASEAVAGESTPEADGTAPISDDLESDTDAAPDGETAASDSPETDPTATPEASPAEPTADSADSPRTDSTPVESAPAPDSSTATEPTPSGEATITSSTTRQEIARLLNSPEITKITLLSDIALNGNVKVERPVSAPVVALDLNGHTMSRSADKGYAFIIREGRLNLTGTGRISGRNGIELDGSAEDVSEHIDLTIGEDVVIEGRSQYGIAVMDPAAGVNVAYGVKLTLMGSIVGTHGISVYGTIQNTEHAPDITVADGASITSTGAADSAAIYAAGNATWHFGAATLSSASGVNIRSGHFTFANTVIKVNGEMSEPTPGIPSSIDSTGVVFQIEHHPAYADGIRIDISGGTYTSEHGDVFYEYAQDAATRAATPVADINISGGTFIAAPGRKIFGGTSETNDIQISGGTFKGTDATTAGFAAYFTGNLQLDASGNVIAATTPVRPNRPSTDRPTTSPEAPEGPSDSEEPSHSTPGANDAPGTGLNQGRGVISAVSTAVPMIIGASSIIFMIFMQKIYSRRKAMNSAEVEMEIDEQIAEIIDEPEEPVIERFVAEPIVRDEPDLPHVDVFIPQDK